MIDKEFLFRLFWRSLLATVLFTIPFSQAVAVESKPDRNSWTTVFEDRFERDTIGFDWDATRGDWRLEKGRLIITRDEGWSSDSMIRLGRPLPGDLRFEFEVSVPSLTTVKAAVKIGEQYWDGGGPAGIGEVALSFGGSPNPASSPVADLLTNTVYRVAVEHAEGVLRAWLNETLVKEETVALDAPYNDGVALFCFNNAAFDNVRVMTRPAAKAQPAAAALESNRRATVDATRFLDLKKADVGFQSAIDSLPPSGGAVLLPKGTFILRQPLFLRHGVALRGQGRDTVLALPSPMVWSKLTADAPRGATTLQMEKGAGFEPGMVLALGKNDAMYYLAQALPWRVRRVEGNTLHLDKPLGGNLSRDTAVGNFFPMIWAANDSDIEVRDLAIEGRAEDPAPFNGGYGASALSFFFVREARVDNVHVTGWKGDAFSFQGGRHNSCTRTTVRQARGHGYHPGSCQRRMILSRMLAEGCSGDGFYFCRYNQESVMGHNVFRDNQGGVFGGLASAGDHFNSIHHNFGARNGFGVPFVGGANDVFFGNVIVDSAAGAVIPISGGSYDSSLKPSQNHPYAGPSRYHVIVGNTLVDTRKGGAPLCAISAAPGAASLVAFGNRYAFANPVEKPVAVNGPNCVDAENIPGDFKVNEPAAPPEPPPLPGPIVMAADYGKPERPDAGFQAALDHAAGKGGTVLLPAGIYDIREPLRIPSGVTLCGEGVATVLVLREPAKRLLVAENGHNVGIRRITLRCADSSNAGESAVAVSRVNGLVLEGITIDGGFTAGLKAVACEKVFIGLCKSRRNGIGYDISGGKDLAMMENYALENSGDGIRLTRVDGPIRLDSNILWRNARHGFTVESAGNDLLAQGNVIASSGCEGALLQGCQAPVFRANVVLNSSLAARGAYAGLLLQDVGAAAVWGNRMGDDGYDPTQTVAVREAGACRLNRIYANVLCPNFWPKTANLARLITLASKDSIAEHNVLLPYPPAKSP